MGRKKLEELTILDNFMFAAAMITDPENCRRVLECALGMEIDRVEVVHEKTMVYHPEFKGIRLDVYAKEMMEDGTVNRHFDVGEHIRCQAQLCFNMDRRCCYWMYWYCWKC